MLSGTMPIASKVGGVHEIVRGTRAEGFLFTPGDADEIVDRVEAILSMHKEQLIDLGVELRESVLKRFDNERIKQQLLVLFEP